jgi:hypothetical protein
LRLADASEPDDGGFRAGAGAEERRFEIFEQILATDEARVSPERNVPACSARAASESANIRP